LLSFYHFFYISTTVVLTKALELARTSADADSSEDEESLPVIQNSLAATSSVAAIVVRAEEEKFRTSFFKVN